MFTLTLKDEYEKQTVLLALEILGNLGIGKFSDVAVRLNLLHKKRGEKVIAKLEKVFEMLEARISEDWRLGDEPTSLYTLVAYLLQARLNQLTKSEKLLEERIAEKKKIK